MHEEAPVALTRGLSAAQASAVTRWWRRLASADREELLIPRRALAIVGRFVEPSEADDDFDVELYEHIVNHEMAFIEERTFHICSAHPTAREAVARRRIPATFRCPNANPRCPMRVLLASSPGHDVKLTVGGPLATSAKARCR